MSKHIVLHQHALNQTLRANLKQQSPCILWFTGLSGSGKSSVANALERLLFEVGKHTYLLDGDNVRYALNKDLKFSEQDRIENIRRVGEVAQLFSDAGLMVLVAFISPYQNDREIVRQMSRPGEFIEIFMNTPIEVCEQRDPKGLYQQARAGKIKDFTGIDSPYEVPINPEITLNQNLSPEEAAATVFDYLKHNQYVE